VLNLIKNVTKALLGVRVPPLELAEEVVREQIRLRRIDPARVPATAIRGIAEEALANGRDPTGVILRIRTVVASIAEGKVVSHQLSHVGLPSGSDA
jgi:hypothetical protein